MTTASKSTKDMQRFLTGITTSGTPHLGNYVGSIRPAVAASKSLEVESFYFLADYHALIKCDDPTRIQRSTLEIAASWLAAGLDPERVIFYRQSDVKQIPELTWFLSCVMGKGALNRAHAYKASVDKNETAGNDPDADITAGLFMYPVLMGADILMFKAHKVPVGRDQIQHIEMARDMAQRFNNAYGSHLVLPEAVIEESVATLPGLDGRKMSKSYNNTIPLFSSRQQLKKLIGSMVTDSSQPGEPKKVEGSAIFQIYQAFASESETQMMREAFANGISWADAKTKLVDRIDMEIAPMRERYEKLMREPEKIEVILKRGGNRARGKANYLMRKLRTAVGLRPLLRSHGLLYPHLDQQSSKKSVLPSTKQYRESDGKFYFKLLAGNKVLLQSVGITDPKEVGEAISSMHKQGALALNYLQQKLAVVEDVSLEEVVTALNQLKEAAS